MENSFAQRQGVTRLILILQIDKLIYQTSRYTLIDMINVCIIYSSAYTSTYLCVSINNHIYPRFEIVLGTNFFKKRVQSNLREEEMFCLSLLQTENRVWLRKYELLWLCKNIEFFGTH